MNTVPEELMPPNHRPYRIVGLNYITLYLQDLREAVAFYTRVFGDPESVDGENEVYGWQMGTTWLTVFPSNAGTDRHSNPRNAEFAVQVADVLEVDCLYNVLVEAGAKSCMAPRDTRMYEPMRFACVDDPFGVRIDVYCPLVPPLPD